MRTLQLALNDLSQLFRDPKIVIFFLAMPIAFTLFMGFALQSVVQPEDPRIILGWVNHDPEGFISQQLYNLLSESQAVKLVEVEASQAATQISNGKVAGVLIVPEGFSSDAIASRPAQLTLLADPLSNTTQSLQQILRTPITQIMGSLEIARINSTLSEAEEAYSTEAENQAEIEITFQAALQAWADSYTRGGFVIMEKATAEKDTAPLGGNPYNQTSPGILVQFTILQTFTSALILVQERKNRCLQRLITTALHPYQVLAGHWLAMFFMVFLQTAILIIFGQLVLEVNYLGSPLGTLLVAITLCLWVASMGLLVGILSKSDEQAILLSLAAMIVFASLGGANVPLDVSHKLFYTIGHLTPGAWAMDGFQNILVRGLGVNSVIQPALILTGFAALFFILAAWRFRMRQI